jgi:integrase
MVEQTNSKRSSNGARRANGEGSIYPVKGTKKWQVAVFHMSNKSEWKRIRRTFATKREAEAFLAQHLLNQGMGSASFFDNPKMTLGQFLDKWVAGLSKEPETMRSYKTAINQWIRPQLGNVLISAVKPRLIEEHYKFLFPTYSNSVLHITHCVLSGAFGEAFRFGEIPYNVMEKVQKLSKPTMQRSPLTDEDAEKILAEASKDPYEAARIEMGMVKVLRPSEVMALRWADIDWNKRTINCSWQLQEQVGNGLVFKPRKTKDTLVLDLSEDQILILQLHRLAQETAKVFWKAKDEDLIFPNSIGGRKGPKADTRDWRNLCQRAGITSHYVRYQMKHTGVTNMLTHGVDDKTTATLSGHGDPVVTLKHYARPTSSSVKKALDAQDSFRPSKERIEEILALRDLEKSDEYRRNI